MSGPQGLLHPISLPPGRQPRSAESFHPACYSSTTHSRLSKSNGVLSCVLSLTAWRSAELMIHCLSSLGALSLRFVHTDVCSGLVCFTSAGVSEHSCTWTLVLSPVQGSGLFPYSHRRNSAVSVGESWWQGEGGRRLGLREGGWGLSPWRHAVLRRGFSGLSSPSTAGPAQRPQDCLRSCPRGREVGPLPGGLALP